MKLKYFKTIPDKKVAILKVLIYTHTRNKYFHDGRNRFLNKERLSKMTGISELVLDQIEGLAVRYGIQRIVLFGSRARGDWKKTSDIDLAVLSGDVTEFTLAVDEQTDTLLMYDVVNLGGTVQAELLESIEKEGIVLYEKV